MFKYVGERRCPGRASTAYTVLSDALFVVFMVSFFVMRLGMFPYICWSAHMEATLYFPKGEKKRKRKLRPSKVK